MSAKHEMNSEHVPEEFWPVVPDAMRTYTELRDFLDRYADERGEIQGDPATIAGEAATAGLVEQDDEFRRQIEDEPEGLYEPAWPFDDQGEDKER